LAVYASGGVPASVQTTGVALVENGAALKTAALQAHEQGFAMLTTTKLMPFLESAWSNLSDDAKELVRTSVLGEPTVLDVLRVVCVVKLSHREDAR
tara:strand:- start:112 stop:399 length:288 start_codon:yes stop_codon:yes gene_type:complete